jgi:hypothetical protein
MTPQPLSRDDDQPPVPGSEPIVLPEGTRPKLDPNLWYRLKARYMDYNGNDQCGYLGPVGYDNGTWADYMIMVKNEAHASQFKMEELDSDGWAVWRVKASNWCLCVKSSDYFYQASYYRIKFAVINGMLYNNYYNGAAGADYSQSVGVPAGYYVRLDLPVQQLLTECELEPV